jgi:hypothetical protein
MFAGGVANPIAGAGSFFTGCANAFPFQFYLLAGFRRGLDAGAFPVRYGGGFRPVTDFSGCCTFGLNTFLFLYYLFAGQRLRLGADAFPGVGGNSRCYPVTNLSGCLTFGLNALLFLYYLFAGQGGGKNISGEYNDDG